jgi:uncharacterized protein
MDVFARIADELGVNRGQVQAAAGLLDEGATVPFISRYRKEATGGLTDDHMRLLETRLHYLRELDKRREVVLESVRSQGKLTDELQRLLLEADSKTRLEDLYLPYKPKRSSKAQTARERGLGPLAEQLLADPAADPQVAALPFVDAERELPDAGAVLDGARQILMETFAEQADLLSSLRTLVWEQGFLVSSVVLGKEQEGLKFKDYFDWREPLAKLPSHRILAMYRGRNEGILALNLQVAEDPQLGQSQCEALIARHFGIIREQASEWLWQTLQWGWKVKLFNRIDVDIKLRLKESAEAEAIKVFAANLKDLLLAAPAGHKAVLGLDPGLRTGVKVAVVDDTGKVVDSATLYPHPPQRQWREALTQLAALVRKHRVGLIAIGNGTASRETERLAKELCQSLPGQSLSPVVVSEAGASVYSASELASRELPDLDVSLRGAVSIARRLQDPLAELVKIDPKSIGVGQYQHDVNQRQLGRSLDAVVEDCVNAVGVDVNTASPALLRQVAGLSQDLANNIVAFRDQHGAFAHRQGLLQVPRLGPKAFEQAAGFLRIVGGDNPLDASAVHPEAYPLVQRILGSTGRRIDTLVGDRDFLRRISPREFVDERFGEPTVRDILRELEKPGRDPRPEFKTARFQEGVESLADLRADMVLEGVVTNVTNFGAFVDIGVHQDGLVHISRLADRFVQDPRDVVKAGDIVRVKVMEVDLQRKRISLTMRLQEQARDALTPSSAPPPKHRRDAAPGPRDAGAGAMARALRDALKGGR